MDATRPRTRRQPSRAPRRESRLRRRRAPLLALTAVLTVVLLAPPLLEAGPPWITVEFPPNPLDRQTRGALLVIHTYHHQRSIEAEISAVAHPAGSDDARSLKLAVTATSRPGVYAVRGDLPAREAWVVVVTMREGEAAASALVALEPGGDLTAVRVPHEVRDGWQIPHAATEADVRAMRETALALAEARRGLRLGAASSGAALTGLVLLPLGALALRRRRR